LESATIIIYSASLDPTILSVLCQIKFYGVSTHNNLDSLGLSIYIPSNTSPSHIDVHNIYASFPKLQKYWRFQPDILLRFWRL